MNMKGTVSVLKKEEKDGKGDSRSQKGGIRPPVPYLYCLPLASTNGRSVWVPHRLWACPSEVICHLRASPQGIQHHGDREDSIRKWICYVCLVSLPGRGPGHTRRSPSRPQRAEGASDSAALTLQHRVPTGRLKSLTFLVLQTDHGGWIQLQKWAQIRVSA